MARGVLHISVLEHTQANGGKFYRPSTSPSPLLRCRYHPALLFGVWTAPLHGGWHGRVLLLRRNPRLQELDLHRRCSLLLAGAVGALLAVGRGGGRAAHGNTGQCTETGTQSAVQ